MIYDEWFSFSEMTVVNDIDIQFLDCTLNKSIGKYKSGDKLEAIEIINSKSEIRLYETSDNDEYIKFNIRLTVSELTKVSRGMY